MLLSKAALPTVATASVTLDPIRASSLCWKDYKNSRVQKDDSRLPSKAFSDAAFNSVYFQIQLSKSALPTVATASVTLDPIRALQAFVGKITKTAAFKKVIAGCLLKPFLTRRLSMIIFDYL